MTEAHDDLSRRGRQTTNTDRRTGKVVRFDIPPDWHTGTIRGEGPGAQTGRAALETIYEAASKINDVARQVQDTGRLAQAAQPYAERALATAGRQASTLEAQVRHLDSEIASTLKAPVAPDIAAQVRAHWAARSQQALTGIRAAIEQGDTATISAVLHAPAYLSGLTDEQQVLLRTMAAAKLAPDHVAQRDEAEAALGQVHNAIGSFTKTMAGRLRQWRDTDAKIIEEALR